MRGGCGRFLDRNARGRRQRRQPGERQPEGIVRVSEPSEFERDGERDGKQFAGSAWTLQRADEFPVEFPKLSQRFDGADCAEPARIGLFQYPTAVFGYGRIVVGCVYLPCELGEFGFGGARPGERELPAGTGGTDSNCGSDASGCGGLGLYGGDGRCIADTSQDDKLWGADREQRIPRIFFGESDEYRDPDGYGRRFGESAVSGVGADGGNGAAGWRDADNNFVYAGSGDNSGTGSDIGGISHRAVEFEFEYEDRDPAGGDRYGWSRGIDGADEFDGGRDVAGGNLSVGVYCKFGDYGGRRSADISAKLCVGGNGGGGGAGGFHGDESDGGEFARGEFGAVQYVGDAEERV